MTIILKHRSSAMRLLLLLCLGRALGVVRSEFSSEEKIFGRKQLVNTAKPTPSEDEVRMIRKIEEEMLALNKSENRDKRALGILLQGFMEALGYTVAPVQLASLPNPTPAAQMPVPAAAAAPPMSPMSPAPPPGMMPMPMPPPPANGTMPPPRQRETLRFTGILNFGNNVNTTHLVNHLAQYENLFHRNGTTPPPPPPPPSAPGIDPRNRGPLPEPLFVKIPIPIVPNLPPPQPPSPMPVQSTYRDEEYSKDQAEEYKGSDDEEGRRGEYKEEDDDSQHREEYESSHEEHHEPEDRHDEEYESDEAEHYEDSPPPPPPPTPQNIEKHTKKTANVVNYSVENRPLHSPSEVSEEAPNGGSKYDHAMYVDEPDWQNKHEEHAQRLAAEQEANAEALAEENAEREMDSSKEHDSREKEIHENNEKHAARYEATDRKEPYSSEDDEDTGSAEKESYSDNRHPDDDDEEEHYEEESKVSERRPAKLPGPNDVASEKPSRRLEEPENSNRKSFHDQQYPRLPISYDRERLHQDTTLRDSYGESLEKPGGKVDERVAGYISMFKNPRTGVYDPNRIQGYQSNSGSPYGNEELVSGYNRIQKDYDRPENKYEEYEIDSNDDDRLEHRSNSRRLHPPSGSHEKGEIESRKKLVTEHPRDCNCSTARSDVDSGEARSNSLTTNIPLPQEQLPLSYGPYYSTVKYLYEPTNYDHNIIQSLTSYGPPSTARFEARPTELTYDSSRPTTVTIPERLVTKGLTHEAETKEIRTWPTPFDYVYDNSELRKVVVKGTPTPLSQESTYVPTTTCYHEAHSLPPGENADRVKILLRQHERESFEPAKSSRNQRRPKASRSGRRAHSNGQTTSRYSTLPTTLPTIFEIRKKPSASTERSVEDQSDRYRSSTYSPFSETRTPFPDRRHHRTTKRPSQSRSTITSRRPSHSPRASSRPKGPQSKPQVKQKYDDYAPLRESTISREIASNYVEKDGILIIPEPTPYYFNERVDDLPEEPESDTEKVKIKEYRNRIASVKMSELKQLHPQGSMEIFKYARHL